MTLVEVFRDSAVQRRHDPGPTSPREESELVNRLLCGDRQAAERLAEITYGRIFASLVKLSGDRELAADLTQETYRRAWASLATFRRSARFSTWLYRIAYNSFLSHVRRPSIVDELPPDQERTLATPAAGPEVRLRRLEDSERLRSAVLELPEHQRYVVTARFWGEIPIREIADVEGITPVAVRKRLRMALVSLRNRLSSKALTRDDDRRERRPRTPREAQRHLPPPPNPSDPPEEPIEDPPTATDPRHEPATRSGAQEG